MEVTCYRGCDRRLVKVTKLIGSGERMHLPALPHKGEVIHKWDNGCVRHAADPRRNRASSVGVGTRWGRAGNPVYRALIRAFKNDQIVLKRRNPGNAIAVIRVYRNAAASGIGPIGREIVHGVVKRRRSRLNPRSPTLLLVDNGESKFRW